MNGWKEFEPVSLDITLSCGDLDDAMSDVLTGFGVANNLVFLLGKGEAQGGDVLRQIGHVGLGRFFFVVIFLSLHGEFFIIVGIRIVQKVLLISFNGIEVALIGGLFSLQRLELDALFDVFRIGE